MRNKTDDDVKTAVLDGFDHILQNFVQQIVGDLIESGDKPMSGIGPKTVEKEIAAKQEEAAQQKKKKRREVKEDRKTKKKRPKGS